MAARKPIDTNQLQALYEQGLSLVRIAEIFGVSPPTIYTYAHRLGLPLRKNHRPRREIDMERVVALYADGLTLAQIAERLGIPHATLCKRAREVGMKLRSHSEALRGRKWDPEVVERRRQSILRSPKNLARIRRVMVTCDQCGKQFVRHYSAVNGHNFCCRACMWAWISNNLRGEKRYNYKREPACCANCGKEMLVIPSRKQEHENLFCSHRCHNEWRRLQTPLDEKGRNSRAYAEWRLAVWRRDNFTCQRCGRRGYKLHAHHIKPWALYPELRFEVSNGITLCEPCHMKEPHEEIRQARQMKLRKAA